MSNTIKETGSDFDFVLDEAKPEIPKLQVKPVIKIEDIPEDMRKKTYTAEDLKQITDAVIAATREHLAETKFNGKTQVISKKNAPIVDFTKLTQEDIYNLDIPMEAKPFMAGDPLKVKLKDSAYEARWVSTNSQRLGYMKSIGFSYVVEEDLDATLESEVSTDAQGHYTINDVVLMKIQKIKYYPALRAAHERSVNTMNATKGMAVATQFMGRGDVANDFQEATQSGQMSFYTTVGK